MRVFGIETEYGVTARGSGVAPEVLSELVIRAIEPGSALGADPLAEAVLGPEDLAANRVLGNGARAYVDHAHPEYSSPETTTPSMLVAYDRAGDLLVREAAARASATTGLDIRVYRNTTDGKGVSYGRHENHLVDRAVPWQRLADVMTGFLVARVPLVGAGRVGIGQRGEVPGYQISQRADFLVTAIGLQTTHDRPILNTRDEPLADPRRWRRLHVITGDPAWNEFQTWLTMGSAALVLAATEAGLIEPLRWADPVHALQTFSHDPTLRATSETTDGRTLTALDALDQHYAACAHHVLASGDVIGVETVAVLEAWGTLLDDLRRDVESTADRLDWVAKHRLLTRLRERTGSDWDQPPVQATDLAWGDVASSPALRLAAAGEWRTVITADDAKQAMTAPPPTTRAWLRGTLVSRFASEVVSAGWDDIVVRRRGGRMQHLPLPEPLEHTAPTMQWASTAPDLESFLLAEGW
jgi:proteasome accessory factor A